MPWSVTQDHDECEGWAVVKDSDGELEGCHETEDDALDQLAALEASESDRRRRYIDRVLDELIWTRHPEGHVDQSSHGNRVSSVGQVDGLSPSTLDGVPDHIVDGPKSRGKTIMETVASREEQYGADLSREGVKAKFMRDMDALTEKEKREAASFYANAHKELREHYEGLDDINEDHGIEEQAFFEASAAFSVQEEPSQQLAMTRDLGRALASGRYDDMDSEELAELMREVGATRYEGSTSASTVAGGLPDRAAKAVRIMRGESTLDDEYAADAQKLRNYANNLMNPGESSGVTLDGWMGRSLVGPDGDKNPGFNWSGASEQGTWDKGISVYFADIVTELAEERDMLPHEAQAMVWSGIRKRSGQSSYDGGRLTPDEDVREPVLEENLPDAE